MDEQIQDIQLSLLRSQTEKYKQEIRELQGKNEKLLAKINGVNKRVNDLNQISNQILQVQNEIVELRKEVAAIYELVRDKRYGTALPSKDSASPDGYSITFRDLQKVSDQGGQTDTKPGVPRFVSHQKTDEMLRKQSPGEPLDKPMEKSLEKSLEQKGARETGTGAENNKAPFPFFKWKF